jgi:hypothetical protein
MFEWIIRHHDPSRALGNNNGGGAGRKQDTRE